MIDAYPLHWPAGWPRTPSADRARARFNRSERAYSSFVGADGKRSSWMTKRDLTVSMALGRVQQELERLRAADVVVSTNVELRNDGLPRSGRRAPDDPGVAVYWKSKDGEAQCMAIDIYDTVAGNLAAVAASIEALRAIERHGGAQILKRAFTGFRALPTSTTAALNATTAAEVLARRTGRASEIILKDREVARVAYREAASRAHPDAGGSTSDFHLIQEARRVLGVHHGAEL